MLFDLKKNEPKPDAISQALYSKHLEESMAKISDINKQVPIPEKNGIVWLQTDISFNAFDLVVWLSEKETIKHLYATTYSISRQAIESVVLLHDQGKIEQVSLMISDSMIKRNPSVIDNLMAMCSTRANIQVKFAWVHAKINLIETHNNHYIIEGSGNWSKNAHYEQYIFAESKEAFEFRKQLFDNAQCKKYDL